MESDLGPFLDKISRNENLSMDESEAAFLQLSQNQNLSEETIATFLTALHTKGESLSEIAGAAKAALKVARPFPRVSGPLLDIVGTGGDGKHTFNISTLAALTVASLGVPVAKHGNRSASGTAGSADLLEQLGVPLEVPSKQALTQLTTHHFTFLYAPYYHSSFKRVGVVRKRLGFRTIFNLLGPLTNPALPSVRLIGVFEPRWLMDMILVLQMLGCKRAWVVHGGSGSDELDLEGENQVVSLHDGKIERLSVNASDAGLEAVRVPSLQDGTVQSNFEQCCRMLQGEEGALHTMVAFNAGAALYLADFCKSLRDAVEAAKEALKKGKPWELVEKLRGMNNE